jgi:hypothetical protein
MNPNHETFVREYLRTSDKYEAYRLAYPKAKESSIRSLVSRLLQTNPDIARIVARDRARLKRKTEAEVERKMKFDYLTKLEARQMLTLTARGTRTYEKEYKIRNGYDVREVKPNHAQMLSAIRQYALMEGWYAPRRTEKKEKPPQPKKEEEKITGVKVHIGGLPMDEFTALYGATTDAYFDPEDGSSKWWPVESEMEKLEELQQRRQARKDAERQQRMTEELKREETAAMYELERRPVDEESYSPQAKVIETLRNEYLEDKDPGKLKELKAVQKMCGLRYLHHRHRYEAEREAGWQFHPLNNALIRKTGTPVNKPGQPAKSVKEQTQDMTNLGFRQEKNHENCQQMSTTQSAHFNQGRHVESRTCGKTSPQPMQAARSQDPPNSQSLIPNSQLLIPNPQSPLTQGYQFLNDLMQDEWDYYIRNQGSTTYKQLNDLKRFIAHRHDPPEIRQMIEEETGWLYHPFEANYAKRNPQRPLVRTEFPGPMRNR